jgi:hypothetical protein
MDIDLRKTIRVGKGRPLNALIRALRDAAAVGREVYWLSAPAAILRRLEVSVLKGILAAVNQGVATQRGRRQKSRLLPPAPV